MLNGKRIAAIVPAAGKGERMGSGVAKQFLELHGKPILLHTLIALHAMPEIDSILLAVREEDVAMVKKMVAEHRLSRIGAVVTGGAERQDSVWNCLVSLKDDEYDIVLIHDAVRPFVKRETVLEVSRMAIGADGAVPVVQPKETIKTLNGDGFIGTTLDRASLVIAQTPQAFNYPVLRESYGKAMAEHFYATDDAAIVEKYGGKVKTVRGDYNNIKITTQEDLRIAAQIILSAANFAG